MYTNDSLYLYLQIPGAYTHKIRDFYNQATRNQNTNRKLFMAINNQNTNRYLFNHTLAKLGALATPLIT